MSTNDENGLAVMTKQQLGRLVEEAVESGVAKALATAAEAPRFLSAEAAARRARCRTALVLEALGDKKLKGRFRPTGEEVMTVQGRFDPSDSIDSSIGFEGVDPSDPIEDDPSDSTPVSSERQYLLNVSSNIRPRSDEIFREDHAEAVMDSHSTAWGQRTAAGRGIQIDSRDSLLEGPTAKARPAQHHEPPTSGFQGAVPMRLHQSEDVATDAPSVLAGIDDRSQTPLGPQADGDRAQGLRSDRTSRNGCPY